MRSHTVYERIGDWPWLLVSGGLIYSAFRRRRQTARPLDEASARLREELKRRWGSSVSWRAVRVEPRLWARRSSLNLPASERFGYRRWLGFVRRAPPVVFNYRPPAAFLGRRTSMHMRILFLVRSPRDRWPFRGSRRRLQLSSTTGSTGRRRQHRRRAHDPEPDAATDTGTRPRRPTARRSSPMAAMAYRLRHPCRLRRVRHLRAHELLRRRNTCQTRDDERRRRRTDCIDIFSCVQDCVAPPVDSDVDAGSSTTARRPVCRSHHPGHDRLHDALDLPVTQLRHAVPVALAPPNCAR